jgi:transcriptional regulator with XRE-family HTH domain
MATRRKERASQVHKSSATYKAAAKHLGQRIRSLRESADLTLEMAAERMDMDFKHLQKIESGVLNVTLVTLVRIAGGFKVPLSELFTTASAPPKTRRKSE